MCLDYDPARPEGERLSVKWRRDIEQNIEERKKWPQVGPHPLADVTGDGRPELILNLFNDTEDGQWHAVALDAVNGGTVWDLPRHFVQGSADVDANGVAELFTTTTNGELVPACGTIELIAAAGEKAEVRQSYQNAAWCVAELPCIGPTWSTTASQGMQHVLLRGNTRPTWWVKSWEADGDAADHTFGHALPARTVSKRSGNWHTCRRRVRLYGWTAMARRPRLQRLSASDWLPTKPSCWLAATCVHGSWRTGHWVAASRRRSPLGLARARVCTSLSRGRDSRSLPYLPQANAGSSRN